MDTIFEFENGSFVSSSTINKITNEFFEIVKKELPKEVLTYECINLIIGEIKSQVKNKEINL